MSVYHSSRAKFGQFLSRPMHEFLDPKMRTDDAVEKLPDEPERIHLFCSKF
jgi:hypothetical protein